MGAGSRVPSLPVQGFLLRGDRRPSNIPFWGAPVSFFHNDVHIYLYIMVLMRITPSGVDIFLWSLFIFLAAVMFVAVLCLMKRKDKR